MVGAIKTHGSQSPPDMKKKLRREILFFFGVTILAFLGFLFAFWTVWLATFLVEKTFYTGESSKIAIQGGTSTPPLQSAEEEMFLPSSFTDLFSSSVYIASTSKEINYDKRVAGSYFVLAGTHFRPGPPLFIKSVNLNTYDLPVVKARISEVDMRIGNGSISWFLSNDGARWSRVNVGEFLRFNNPNGHLLFWRAEILPSLNSEPSFSLDRIRIDYRVKQ